MLFSETELMIYRVATLPGDEDIEGLEALLDPSTFEGRVARIGLLTRGPGSMSLAMSPTLSTSEEIPVLQTPGSVKSEYSRIDPAYFGEPPDDQGEIKGVSERTLGK
jgi:hypothetical protein